MKIFLRIITLPFVIVVFLVWIIRLTVIKAKDWLVYGGELVVHNDKINRDTLVDLYNIVKETHQK